MCCPFTVDKNPKIPHFNLKKLKLDGIYAILAVQIKEQDPETGFYYYGARYLNPKTSMWISADPAMGEYIPQAPINDEAKKHNEKLPGMGGVFNYVNHHVYHYSANNPVKYVDPDGRDDEIPILGREPTVQVVGPPKDVVQEIVETITKPEIKISENIKVVEKITDAGVSETEAYVKNEVRLEIDIQPGFQVGVTAEFETLIPIKRDKEYNITDIGFSKFHVNKKVGIYLKLKW
jgi:RHS repeat-associated protein